MTESVLQVTGLTAGYGEKTILRRLSFSVQPGELIGIVGPNGVGKSTLLKSLRGLIPVDAGEVCLMGTPLAQLSERDTAKRVAYLQQAVETGFGYSCEQVVLAGRYPYLRWWEREKEQDREIVKRNMAFMGVSALASKPLRQISGGQRQRVLLAKVLAQETPLLFLDEPTTGLDLLYQEEIFRYCRLLCAKGKTILMVVHDLSAAARFCSRLMLLSPTGLVADGAPVDVLTREHLSVAYDIDVKVVQNMITGGVDICTMMDGKQKKRGRVHVICGGGSGGDVLRQLYSAGYELSAGVLQYGDTDGDVAEVFGGRVLRSEPFSPLQLSAVLENERLAADADWVVLTNLCIGNYNLGNLQAAQGAKHLLILEDDAVEERDFTDGSGTELYYSLCQSPQTKVMRTNEVFNKLSALETREEADDDSGWSFIVD